MRTKTVSLFFTITMLASASVFTFGTAPNGDFGVSDGSGNIPVTGPIPSVWAIAPDPYSWISDANTFEGGIVEPNGYAADFYIPIDVPLDQYVTSATETVCADDSTTVFSNSFYYGIAIGFSGTCTSVDITNSLTAGHNVEGYQTTQLFGGDFGLLVYGSVTTAPIPQAPEPATIWLSLAILSLGFVLRRKATK